MIMISVFIAHMYLMWHGKRELNLHIVSRANVLRERKHSDIQCILGLVFSPCRIFIFLLSLGSSILLVASIKPTLGTESHLAREVFWNSFSAKIALLWISSPETAAALLILSSSFLFSCDILLEDTLNSLPEQ